MAGVLSRRPRVMVGIPSGITEVEKRAVIEAAMKAGRARRAHHRRADGRGDWRRIFRFPNRLAR